jgi:hypothetical protein
VHTFTQENLNVNKHYRDEVNTLNTETKIESLSNSSVFSITPHLPAEPNFEAKKSEELNKSIVKSDRETQFWEAEECKNIKPFCTKEDVLNWIKENPNYDFKIMYDKFGVGCVKFRNELRKEGLI